MKKVNEVLKAFCLTVGFTVILTPLLMKACDAEYDYQQAKYEQWQHDSKLNQPFTDFTEAR